MHDTIVRQLDDSMLRRIEALAQARHWSTNTVLLHALHHGLRVMAQEVCIDCDAEGSAAMQVHDWGSREADAFDAAVRALSESELVPYPAI